MYETVGARLKSAREKNHISVDEAGDRCKLPARFIKALEEGNFQILGGKIYSQNYGRSYAVCLDIDSPALAEDLEREYQMYAFRGARSAKLPHSWLSIVPKIGPKSSTAIIGSVAAFLVIAYFVYQLSFLLSAPQLSVAEPGNKFTLSHANFIDISGSLKEDAKVSINHRPVTLDENRKFNERLYLSEGLNRIDIEAGNISGKSIKETRYVRFVN